MVYSLERCAGSENEGKPLVSAFSVVERIEAADDSHVVVTLSEPSLEFLNALTAPIIPKDSGPTITETMIGTGPFRFVSYAPQDSLVMEKYDGYWNQEKAASLDEVTFKIVPDVNAMVIGLKGGTLDMVVHLPNTLEREVKDQFTVHQDTMKLVQALYLNNAVEPFDNELVRQAMYYAIDVNEIIEFVCNGAGVATGTSMYPAQNTYFVPELAERYQPDVEKAKELLAQAGYPDGFSMTITAPSNYAQHMDTAQVIIEQLKQAGITAELAPIEWESWVSDVYRGRDYQSTVCGISADDMTAREMLVRYMSDNQKNFINFQDEEFDDVMSRAMTATDSEEAGRAVQAGGGDSEREGGQPVDSGPVRPGGAESRAGRVHLLPHIRHRHVVHPLQIIYFPPRNSMGRGRPWDGPALLGKKGGFPRGKSLTETGGAACWHPAAGERTGFRRFLRHPGDPTTSVLGAEATREEIAAFRAQHGLDLPVWQRYWSWLAAFVTGDFGRSFKFDMPVSELVATRAQVTLVMAALSFALIVAISLPLGLISARRRGASWTGS